MKSEYSDEIRCKDMARRNFVRFLLMSPLAASAGLLTFDRLNSFATDMTPIAKPREASNVFQFEEEARKKLPQEMFHFISDGADDLKTLRANRDAFDRIQIRARRLVNTSKLTTSTQLFGDTMKAPILLSPVGAQQRLHPRGELATALGAAKKETVFITATLSNYSIKEIAETGKGPIWFQLYANPDRNVMKQLLKNAEDAGATVVVLTVDTGARGNRELQFRYETKYDPDKRPRLGNYEGIQGKLMVGDNTMGWEIIRWLKDNTRMKVVLKGIVTHEDARLCVKNGADGLIISNHGGRQEESNRSTIECLPEIVDAVQGKIPVLIDSGFRRGTDIFKALALGAQGVCIGRPYLWGLSTFGRGGVQRVIALLQAELVRIMKLAGTPTIQDITSDFVTIKD